MMELLAPAGSPAGLWAALSAGADAVYLGGKQFSARRFAGNFSKEEMAEAVSICHALGVSVYVTLNTLVADTEMPALCEYLDFLGTLAPDGLLVQDLGVAHLARERIPHVPLHASTQMTVSDLAGVRFLSSLGFSRVVLSRELSLAEISEIAHGTETEIEVFVHGALCVCYSGQCLMSSFIGGRSGNRGACAQPCRMPYTLVDEAGRPVGETHAAPLLSLKDMLSLDRLAALSETGVVSLKVEGRMKEPSYVYAVISAYRRALTALARGDACDTEALLRTMQAEFYRGYTHGYQDHFISGAMRTAYAPGNRGIPAGTATRAIRDGFCFVPSFSPAMETVSGVAYVTAEKGLAFAEAAAIRREKDGKCSVRTEKPALSGGEVFWVLKQKKETFDCKTFSRRPPLSFLFSARAGEPFRLSATDSAGHTATATSEQTAERARKEPTAAKDIAEGLLRLGNTIFAAGEMKIENAGCLVPKSIVNRLRREVCEEMMRLRREDFENKRPVPLSVSAILRKPVEESFDTRLLVRTDDAAQAKAALSAGAGVIFGGESFSHRQIPLSDYQAVLDFGREKNLPVIFASHRVVREERSEAERKRFLALGALCPDAMEIERVGELAWAEEIPDGVPLIGGAGLNLFNAEALQAVADWGLSSAFLSQELTLAQIRHMAEAAPFPVGVCVYGRTEIMVSEYCAVNAALGGGACKERCPAPCERGRYSFRDGGGRLFPIRTDEACHMHILNSACLDMRPFMEKLSRAGVSRFVMDVRGSDDDVGALVSSFAAALSGHAEPGRSVGVTRGHFFRGVLG